MAELDRLKNGGGDLTKRYNRFVEYMNRVADDPLNTDFLKDSLDQYRAAPFKTGQYRIFFELIDETVDFNPSTDTGIKVSGKFIHFVWMNNENCKHDSSKGEHDPCYREFKNLKSSGRLDKFERSELSKGYVCQGVFGKALYLYPKFCDADGVAQSQASVSIIDDDPQKFNLYKLEGLISHPDSIKREKELLENILIDAKKCGVRIIWEIIRDGNFHRYQKHAISLGMKLEDSDSVWEVYSN